MKFKVWGLMYSFCSQQCRQKYPSALKACCESEMICIQTTYPSIPDPHSARMSVNWQRKKVTEKSNLGLNPDPEPDQDGFSGSTSHQPKSSGSGS
jgi:hypothetical protein